MNSEKNLKKAVLLIVLSVLVVGAVFASILFQSKGEYSDSYFYSMDTYVEIIGDNEIKDDVKDIFTDTEKIFSCHDENSELYKLNQSKKENVSTKLSDALKHIVKLNEKYGDSADITIGALTSLWDITGNDPKVPSDSEIKSALEKVGYKNIMIDGNNVSLKNNASIDFGCAAKGLALDYVKEMLDKKSSGKAIVSAGGSSILLYGKDSFTTSILSPENDEIIGTIHTSSGFISTSGGYHRYADIDGKKYIHILDTKTGKPSDTDLTSVTVYCQSGIDSDFISTLIFAEGSKNLKKYLNSDDFQIVAIDKNKNVYASPELKLELQDSSFVLSSVQ